MSWNHPWKGPQDDSRVLTSVARRSELPHCHHRVAPLLRRLPPLPRLAEPIVQPPPPTQESPEQPDFITHSHHQGNPQLLPLARFARKPHKCRTVRHMR